jgi:transposase
VSVFEGNTGDPKTLLPQVDKLREQFAIERFVLVGDRGMITQKQIDALRNLQGVDWISALRPGAINQLLKDGAIQMGLFDERNLFEIEHPDFPGERLVACRNPELAQRRAAKRTALLEATAAELAKVCQMVQTGRLNGKEVIEARVRKVLAHYKIGNHYQIAVREDGFDYTLDRDALLAELSADRKPSERRLAACERHIEAIAEKLAEVRRMTEQGRLRGKDAIGVRVGKVVNRYKVAKHFVLHIEDNAFHFAIDHDNVDAEAALDGIDVVRTSVATETLNAAQTVRSYKLLSNVEHAFRCLKSVDLMVRPIRHRLEDRVRARIFLCMLAYYVQWHMTEVLRLFAHEDQAAKRSRDPVAPARRSEAALHKVNTLRLDDDSIVHSFRTLLDELGRIVRNTCRCLHAEPKTPTFTLTTSPNAKQQKALDVLQPISP